MSEKTRPLTVGEIRDRLSIFDADMPVYGLWESHLEPVVQVYGVQHRIVLDVDKRSDGSRTADDINDEIGQQS